MLIAGGDYYVPKDCHSGADSWLCWSGHAAVAHYSIGLFQGPSQRRPDYSGMDFDSKTIGIPQSSSAYI